MFEKIKQLKRHAGFMRYFHNTSWLMGERILRMGVGLFVGIWIARYLGPEQFGLLSYAQSFVFLFTAIATLGLDGIVVRELVNDGNKRDVLLGTAFGLKLIGAFIILPILFLAVQLTNNDSHTNLLVFIIASATIFQSFNVIDFYYQSKVLSKYVALTNTVVLALSSVVKIVFLLNEAPLLAFALMTVFDGLVLAMGLVCVYMKTSGFKLSSWVFNWVKAKSLLGDSWPLILSSLVISIYMKIDQVMIKEMLDAELVGQYAAAARVSELWYFIPVVIANSIFPGIINAKKKGDNLYYQRMQSLYDLMAWLAILIMVPILFFSDEIVWLLFGYAYNQSGAVLSIHILAMVFIFLGVPSSKWGVVENMQKHAFYRSLAGLVLNLALNYFLIPMYSTQGAALATLISYSFAAYFYNLTDRRLFVLFSLQTNALLLPFRKIGLKI
ncbi:MAG: flippase [Gammaproteobacteria bacterium]